MKDGIQFINGYKPVETYRNGIKIAGSTPATKTGTHLTFENTYDDYAHELIISGNTLEIGTGDKTPDNPYEFASADGNLISSDENGTKTDTIAIPTLRRIAHAPLSINVADEYNIVNGMFTKRLNEVTLTGTEAWYYNTSTSTSSYTVIYLGASGLGMLTNSQCICTHFPRPTTGDSEGWIIGSLFNLRFANSRLGVTSENTQQERLDAAKAWLAARHTAGTPVKVIYQLATPQVTQLEAKHLKTFYPFTQVFSASEIQPNLEATVKCYDYPPVIDTSDNWEVTDNVLNKYIGIVTSGMTLTVPNRVDDIKVSEIWNPDADYLDSTKRYNIFDTLTNSTVSSIVISEGIEIIGACAFHGCTGLTGNLVFPESLRVIGKLAFNNCNKLSGNIYIPDSVGKIGSGAFNGCTSLNGTLRLPPNITEIEAIAFQSCAFIGNLNLPPNLKTLGRFVFYTNNFTGQLVLPESLEYIGSGCFKLCMSFQNTVITIPKNVSYIGGQAFYGTADVALSAMEVDPDNDYFIAVDGVLFTKDMNRLLKYPPHKTATHYVVPEGVEFMDMGCFDRTRNLLSIHLPNSILYVRDTYPPFDVFTFDGTPFYACMSLQEFAVNEDHPWLAVVDGVLFTKDMTQLIAYPISRDEGGEYTVPTSVTYIGREAFNYCKLSKIYIPSGTTWHADAFLACSATRIII